MSRERDRIEIAKMLRRVGYRQPISVATRLQGEGMGPAEVAWRLQAGQQFQDNPLSSTNVLYALGGAAIVGVIGYLLWKKSQDAAAAEAQGSSGQTGQTGWDSTSGTFVNSGSGQLGPQVTSEGTAPSPAPTTFPGPTGGYGPGMSPSPSGMPIPVV